MKKPSESTAQRVADNLGEFTRDLFSRALYATFTAFNFLDTGIYSDEEIEYWGRYFVDNKFAARGILFETFMTDPFEISQAVLFDRRRRDQMGDEVEFYPLLPKQREAAQRVRVEMSGRRYGKSLRAHSRPLDAIDLVFLKRQAD